MARKYRGRTLSTVWAILADTRTPLRESDALRFAVDSKQAACYTCVTMSKYISSTPDIMGGAPVIKGTRTPIEVILYRLKEGNSVEAIHAMYP